MLITRSYIAARHDPVYMAAINVVKQVLGMVIGRLQANYWLKYFNKHCHWQISRGYIISMHVNIK